MNCSLMLRWVSLLPVAGALFAGTPASWEAESGSIAGPIARLEDRGASGGIALQVRESGRVAWIVELEQAGRYELNFRYRTGGAARWPRFEVNGRERGLGLAATFGEWHEVAQMVTLRAGANTLALAGSGPGFDLDLLRFTMLPGAQVAPLYELPVISPREARIDLRAPQPLQFLLRRNGHATPRVWLAGRELPAEWAEFAPVDDALRLRLPAAAFAGLPAGPHALRLAFADGAELAVPLVASAESQAAPLLIATLDVSHGKATVLRLPDGQVALIDCAQEKFAHERLLPFLAAHGIRRIDHVFITHYHDDHDGGLRELQATLPVGQIHDYRSYRTGEKFSLGGADWFVLNAYDAGSDENSRSLALQVTYRGFVYTDGADNYASNQAAAREKFPERTRSHVYYGNHHFHGSVDVDYLRRTDAALFLVSAEAAVYARAAYTEHFVRQVEAYLKTSNGRLRETLVTAEVGHILLRVHDADRWSYETLPLGGVFADFAAPPASAALPSGAGRN